MVELKHHKTTHHC